MGDDLIVLDPARVMPKGMQESKYTPRLADEIIKAVAENPVGLHTLIARNKHWPSYRTIYWWRVKHPDFNAQFILAQKMRAAGLMDSIREIVDDAENDLIEIDGKLIPNPVSVQRARVRAEFYERVAKRLDPATWGDKLDVNANVGYLPQDEAIKYLK